MLGLFARMWLIRRLFGDPHRHRSGYRGYSRRPPARYGRHRSSGGFGMFGPFPQYSTRTRRGTRVSVGGCCLPIPLALVVGVLGAVRLLVGRG